MKSFVQFSRLSSIRDVFKDSKNDTPGPQHDYQIIKPAHTDQESYMFKSKSGSNGQNKAYSERRTPDLGINIEKLKNEQPKSEMVFKPPSSFEILNEKTKSHFVQKYYNMKRNPHTL